MTGGRLVVHSRVYHPPIGLSFYNILIWVGQRFRQVSKGPPDLKRNNYKPYNWK